MGSIIKVINSDGSRHIEEIIHWDVDKKIEIQFYDFHSPLQYFASHFIETWEFNKVGDVTDMTRTMTMYPKGLLGWIFLKPLSLLMKKSFENNLIHLNQEKI